MKRRQNFQTIAWFNDLFKRDLLDLDPPYQRRSVWTQSFKDYFIETILLDYPAPTIFLYEEINETGLTTYHVVDGKQRLTSIFQFINNEYPVSEESAISDLRGKYFQDFNSDNKAKVWSFSFSVEYLPNRDESIINNIFDRINRNVAKLTPQELRHAKFSGVFINVVEELTDWTLERFPQNFPQIAQRSRSQMKDVELVAQILLRIEGQPEGYTNTELDEAFNSRDDFWENKDKVIDEYKKCVSIIIDMLEKDSDNVLVRSRLRNQADFYSLVGAILVMTRENLFPDIDDAILRLKAFIDNDFSSNGDDDVSRYGQFARTASNRTSARKGREDILVKVLQGLNF